MEVGLVARQAAGDLRQLHRDQHGEQSDEDDGGQDHDGDRHGQRHDPVQERYQPAQNEGQEHRDRARQEDITTKIKRENRHAAQQAQGSQPEQRGIGAIGR